MNDAKVSAVAASVAARTGHSTGVGPQYVLSSIRYWDVGVSPTKRYMVAGRFVPSVRGGIPFLSKRRRITVELYKPNQNVFNVDQHNKEQTRKLFNQLLKGVSSASLLEVQAMEDDDLVSFRVLKATHDNDRDENAHDGDWEARSIGSMSVSTIGFGNDGVEDDEFEDKRIRWKERYRCPLDTLQIVNTKGRACDVKMGANDGVILKTITFESKHDLETFVKVLDQMTRLGQERGKRLATSYKEARSTPPHKPYVAKLSAVLEGKGHDFKQSPDISAPSHHLNVNKIQITEGIEDVEVSINEGSDEGAYSLRARLAVGVSESDLDESFSKSIHILVEIVSASNLPVADTTSSDPYVKVYDGSNEIHRTDVIPKTLNPVWTVATKSLFLISTTIEEFFAGSNFLTFELRDYDTFKKNNTLGTVDISKETLLKGDGRRLTFEIVPPGKREMKRMKSETSSTLALRFREATTEDVLFMKSLTADQISHKTAVYATETFVPPRDHKISIMSKTQRRVHDHFKEYHVKPFPDPDRQSETTWLTKKEIHFEASRPSRYWIESGSGDLGKIYVEVLWCDNLPNLDVSLTGRDKTDAFACLVFEDSIVNTDVISDCLCPRWMPWSQRAFVFNVMHPSSQILVGVFDFDAGFAQGGHDPVGRVVVNPTNLRPNTLYTTTYTIHEFSKGGRIDQGTITLRIRVELPNPRKALLAGVVPVLHYDVSVEDYQNFQVVHHTIHHGENPGVLSLPSISSYVQELQSYLGAAFYLQPAISTVLLWRGHFPVNFRVPWPNHRHAGVASGFLDRWTRVVTVKLPIHSMVSFGWGIALARNFEVLPAFLVFTVGWFLLATMELARSCPSPLYQPRSYLELMHVLFLNGSLAPETIGPDENRKELEEYFAKKVELKRAREEIMKTIEMEQKKYEAFIEAETSKLEENVDITTKAKGGISSMTLAPFKGVLLPLQQALHVICVVLRITNSVVVWRDSYLSFWIVTASFAATWVLIWVPWAFLIRWSLKITVWVVLGPWMKLLDIFYFQRIQSEKEKRKQDLAQRFHERYEMLIGESLFRQIRNETALKLKDMKKYMFGQYLMRVPVYKEERFVDDPVPSSFAEPFDGSEFGDITVIDRKYGQLLEGDMIPRRRIKRGVVQQIGREASVREGLYPIPNALSNDGLGESDPLLLPRLEEGYGSTVKDERGKGRWNPKRLLHVD